MKDMYISGKDFTEKMNLVEQVEKDIENETMYQRSKFKYIMLNICAYEKHNEETYETKYRAKYLIDKKSRGKNSNEYIRISIEKYYNDTIECYMQTVEMSGEEMEKWY